MIQFVYRHRKAALALSSLLVLLLVSAIAWAVPGGDGGGSWSLREEFECENSSLYCVVWEFTPGEPSGPPCCVTGQNYFNNVPTCANSNIL